MIYTTDEIRQRIIPVAQKYNIKNIWLFGSYARGNARENSDIDLVIDTAGTELDSLFTLGALFNDLTQALEKEVDIVTLNALSQRPVRKSDETFGDTVSRERVVLYEAA